MSAATEQARDLCVTSDGGSQTSYPALACAAGHTFNCTTQRNHRYQSLRMRCQKGVATLKTSTGPFPGCPIPQMNPNPDPRHHASLSIHPPPVHQDSILLCNESVTCQCTVTAADKVAAPCGQRWLSACEQKLLATTWPAEEGTWDGPGLQLRAVRGYQSGRRRQFY